MYRERGIGALARHVLQPPNLVQRWARTLEPYALLANLAVAPTFRRAGLGRELCEFCALGCEQWGMDHVLLQVEEAQAPWLRSSGAVP